MNGEVTPWETVGIECHLKDVASNTSIGEKERQGEF